MCLRDTVPESVEHMLYILTSSVQSSVPSSEFIKQWVIRPPPVLDFVTLAKKKNGLLGSPPIFRKEQLG